MSDRPGDRQGGERDPQDDEPRGRDPHYSEQTGHRERGWFWRSRRREDPNDYHSRGGSGRGGVRS